MVGCSKCRWAQNGCKVCNPNFRHGEYRLENRPRAEVGNRASSSDETTGERQDFPRPRSARDRYVGEKIKQLREKHPNTSWDDLREAASAQWEGLSNDRQRKAELTEQAAREMEEWKAWKERQLEYQAELLSLIHI